MQSIQTVTKNLEKALKEFPEKRERTVDAVSDMALSRVRSSISSRLNDSHGKIANWQHKRVGDKGGYGVIEAVGGKEAVAVAPNLPSSGDGSPGAITNAIEHGHKTRIPHDAQAKRYKKKRRRFNEVRGRFFYKAAEPDVERIAQQAADTLCSNLVEIIEGS